MKHLLYIPFLVLMAVTYTRLVNNYNSGDGFAARRPASVQAEEIKDAPSKFSDEDCVDMPARFNPHLKTKNCSL